MGLFRFSMLSMFRPSARILKTCKPAGATHSFQLLSWLPGHGDIALYGPIYVTTACFHDGPAGAADEPPLTGQCRSCKTASRLAKASRSFQNNQCEKATVLLFMCSSWQPAHLCKEHISLSMRTYRRQLFL